MHKIDPSALLSATEAGFAVRAHRAVAHMNEDHRDAIRLYAEVLLGQPKADWQMAGLDVDGMDLIAEGQSARLWFDPPLEGAEAIRKRLVDLVGVAQA